jgi:hypothetical protein
MSERVNRSGEFHINDWSCADVPWRAVWPRPKYFAFVNAEARKRAHALALSLGILTAIIWASAVYSFCGVEGEVWTRKLYSISAYARP